MVDPSHYVILTTLMCLGGVTVECRTYDRMVVGLIPGWDLDV